ncbi:prephenate dehydratase [Desulfococcaceae bacterium HSG8]|nr:prephenate dehydratase [Desulfococcaceae bacterium HSG8]
MENSEKTRADDDANWRISEIRAAIDDIDEKLLELLNKRLGLALTAGRAKAQKGAQVLDNTRENAILQRVSALNKGPLTQNSLRQIFKQIMAASRELQRAHRVTYLGPEATFTHIAAMNHFGESVSFIPQSNIREVFREVEKGACHYGVVPIENSIEGSVNSTLDLFFESNLKICAEKYQPISHDLLSVTGNLEDIRVIYSHPQAFAQCRLWLQKYVPNAALEECSSTAHAAQKASELPGTAAIASNEASHMYNLEILASGIEDVARNTTRFLVIGKEPVHRTGNDKTSVMFVTSHIPGALYHSLKPMADSGVNMVKLESRPTKHENWSYFFFADVEGHMEDAIVKETVEKMKEICLYVKWLGSYPKVEESEK